MGAAGQRRDPTAALTWVVDRAQDIALTEPDAARVLPVVPGLAPLLPWPGGIRRSATLSATGSASLLFMLLAASMAQGAWAVVVGMRQLCVLPGVKGSMSGVLALQQEIRSQLLWRCGLSVVIDPCQTPR